MKSYLKITLLTAALMLIGNVAQALTIDFSKIASDDGSALDLSEQLSVEVIDNRDGTASFTFTNDVDSGVQSSITDVYFDEGDTDLITGIALGGSSDGVSFDTSPSPADLPGGNTIGFSSDFGGDSTSPKTSANGVDATGEFVTFMLTLGSDIISTTLSTSSYGFLGGSSIGSVSGPTVSFKDLIVAIMAGEFRIGLHLQAIADGFDSSDSYASGVSPVPVPAAGLLFGSALFGAGLLGRRKKKAKNNAVVSVFARTS